MPRTCFENDMDCLFCGEPVHPATLGGGFICDREQSGCGAYYLNSGLASMAEVPEWYEADGFVELMQDTNNGVIWEWCAHHADYETNGGRPPQPCRRQIELMTPLLSG